MRLNVIKNEPYSPELLAIINAAKKRLPEMLVHPTALDDPINFKDGVQQWQEQKDSDDALRAITGSFFEVQISKVTVQDGEKQIKWVQPGIIAKSETAEDSDGNPINLSGLVISLCDTQDRMLFRMNNEPFARAEKINGREIHPKIQPSMQTSVTKMAAVIDCDSAKDKGLAELLKILKERHISLDDLDWELADSAHDGNRIQGEVAYTSIELDPKELDSIAEKIGGFVLTHDQLKELLENKLNLFNPHSLFSILTLSYIC